MSRNYRDLVVWQRAHQLVLRVYEETKRFPAEEKFCLTDQMRRAAYSVPANIAEGSGRETSKDYLRFLSMALGSLKELEYFLLLSKDLTYLTAGTHEDISHDLLGVFSPLQGLIQTIKRDLNIPPKS